MTNYLKLGLKVFPWLGMLLFLGLYLVTLMDQALKDHYSGQTYEEMKTRQKQLVSTVVLSRDFDNHREYFAAEGWLDVDSYGGKYAPWTNTQMGLVRFDENGFINAVCAPELDQNERQCPPQL